MRKLTAIILLQLIIKTLYGVSPLSLTSTNDYLWCTGSAPYRIEGYGSGSVTTNYVDRGEDIAFLTECRYERDFAVGTLSPAWNPYEPFEGYGGHSPFPGLAPNHLDALYLLTDYSYANPSMSTNGVGVCFVYGDAALTDGLLDIGNTSDPTNVMLRAMRGTVPHSRSFVYRIGNGLVTPVVAHSIFGLYKDFRDNDGITFRQQQRCDGYVSRSLHGGEQTYARVVDGTHYEIAYSETPPSIAYYTNTTASSTSSLYRDYVTISKNKNSMYDGRTLLDEVETYSRASGEIWHNGLSGQYITFHAYYSNKIDRISAVAAIRVNRTKSYRYNTNMASTTADVVVTNTVILAPISVTSLGYDDNGRPRYSVGVTQPGIGNAIIDWMGLHYPGQDADGTFAALPYPARPPSRYDDIWHYSINGNTVTDDLSVECIGIYGIIKMIYHAREILD